MLVVQNQIEEGFMCFDK